MNNISNNGTPQNAETKTYNMGHLASLRDAVGDSIAELGKQYSNMVVMTADVDTSSRIQAFKELFPDRCYNVGIAEQNMISIAAGLAIEGYKPVTFAFATFATMRSCEQIRTDVCYPNLPVIIIGNNGGYSNGISGCTHCGLEDAGIMASMANMTVIEPSNPQQMIEVLKAAMEWDGPVYIRMGRIAMPSLYKAGTKYEIGKALVPRKGMDGAFICSGIMVSFAVQAAERIYEELGKEIRVVDMHTIKPLDEEAVIEAAKTGRVVAAQDHNKSLGLVTLVGSAIAKAGISCKFKIRGCPDEFVPIATPEFLYKRNKMDVDGLYQTMKELF